jgi:phage head maturation protease
MLETRELEATFEVRSEPERIIETRLMRWGEIAQTPQGPERFIRGAFRGTDPETVTLEAIGPHGSDPGVRLAGRGVALEERDDGPYLSVRVSKTTAGDELLELVRDRVYRRVSVVFEPAPGGSRIARDGVTERTRALLARVGVVERGAYASAEVLAVRSADMTLETPTPVPDPVPDPVPNPTPDPVPPGARVDVLGRMDELRADLVNRMIALEGRGAASTGSELARYGDFREYADAVYTATADRVLMARALLDQITSDNPGVMQPAWLLEVKGIIARRRPAIEALGGARSLGSEGMALNWPYLDPALNIDNVVAVQAAQKTEINSVLVKLLTGTSPIATYAGGSDVSYQLIRRSSPSYRDAYLRILNIAYARETEAAFETALLNGATSSLVLTATATADQVRAFMFAASALVEDFTGAPATVDLVSSAEFARLGGLAGLWPTPYGTSNITGTATASTLVINVSGLPVIRAPFLTGNTHLVTNPEAAGWHEDGPFPISAEDVAKLGQNIAIWGMGSTAIYIPKGIVKSTLTLTRAEEEEAKGKSK